MNQLFPNGDGPPHFSWTTGGLAPTTHSFDMPYADISTPEEEDWQEKSIIHEVQSFDVVNPTGKLLKKVFGFYPVWAFNWDRQYLSVTDFQNVAAMLNNQNGSIITLQPHNDYNNSDGFFPVIVTSTNLRIVKGIGVLPGGANGLILTLKSSVMLPSIIIREVPIPIPPNVTVAGGSGTPMEGGVI